MYISRIVALITTVLVSTSIAFAGPTPEEKCQANKNKAAGKFAACLAGAEKFAIAGDSEKYASAILKCGDKVIAAWNKLEAKAADAGASCPTTGDLTPIADFMAASEFAVSQALAGLPLLVDPLTCAAQVDSLTDEVANLTDEVTDLTTTVNDLESQMRCPTTGIDGSYLISLPDLSSTCTGTLSQSGSSVSFPIDCSGIVGSISLTGSVTGNMLTLSQIAVPICGNANISVSLTIDNDCVTSAGSFSCGPISGTINAERL